MSVYDLIETNYNITEETRTIIYDAELGEVIIDFSISILIAIESTTTLQQMQVKSFMYNPQSDILSISIY